MGWAVAYCAALPSQSKCKCGASYFCCWVGTYGWLISLSILHFIYIFAWPAFMLYNHERCGMASSKSGAGFNETKTCIHITEEDDSYLEYSFYVPMWYAYFLLTLYMFLVSVGVMNTCYWRMCSCCKKFDFHLSCIKKTE